VVGAHLLFAERAALAVDLAVARFRYAVPEPAGRLNGARRSSSATTMPWKPAGAE
jgi:hypothetical protein